MPRLPPFFIETVTNSGEHSMKTPPKHLAGPERALWKSITSEFNIGDSPGLALLAAACEAAARCRRAREIIDREGEMPGGKPHPLLAAEVANRKAFTSLIKQLELDVEVAALPGRPTTLLRRIK
jgi:hypothetical protein